MVSVPTLIAVILFGITPNSLHTYEQRFKENRNAMDMKHGDDLMRRVTQ